MKLILISLITLFMSVSTEKKTSVHDFTMKSIDGKDVSLSSFKGKKLLIVNVASKCGYTPQYKELEALSKKYAGKLVVLGFPANNFGSQEPGSNDEIKGFCEKNYGVTFPMFAKISVKGKDVDPLYAFLSNKDANGTVGTAPSWNFCKYLVDENGKVLKFFSSGTDPMSKEITELL
jgi:glutathione peroxidase